MSSGKRGRPRKLISALYLKEVFTSGRNITATHVARVLGLHRHTVRKYCTLFEARRPKFSDISDENLDMIIKHYKSKHPGIGIRYVRGFLLLHKIRVQKK
jgi:hypothetical protein